MGNLYQQVLMAMPIEDVSFILSQIETTGTPACPDNSTNAVVTENDHSIDDESRRRRYIDREWPAMGTTLSSEYYGVTYTAEVIPAKKKLKSGRQIRLTSGPAQGTVCDSFSEAMITATDKQRTEQNLGRKGTSNGWLFWDWPGKPENIAGGADDADED